MSDHEGEEEEMRHKDFLVSMTSLEGADVTDARFKLTQGNDDRPILDQPLSDLLGESVTVESLLKTTSKSKQDQKIAKTFKASYDKTVSKNKALRLDAPASTVEEAKVARSATRQKVTEQMTKWDAAVHSRRAATTVSFPLQKADMSLKSAKDQTLNFKNKTPLELEVAKLLYGSKAVEEEDGQAKDTNTVGLSVREMREKLSELAKIRAHEAYQQAKLKRQNKIKSKKYRRQLRKEKKKEMEALEGGEGEDGSKKKDEADLQRATERASLKHTKASKNLHFLAKHKDNSVKNQVLAEKDRKKRELKVKEDQSSDEEEEEEIVSDDDDPVPDVDTRSDPNNPWTVSLNKGQEEGEAKLLEMVKAAADKKKAEMEAKKNVNPNDFMQINIKNQNFADADTSDDDEDDEGLAESRSKITEAFANDDDILRDFRKEAQEKAAAKKAKNAKPAAMPGWGNWASSDADMKQKRKRKCEKHREILREKASKKPKLARNSNSDKGYRVIVNESAKGQSARAHQTSSVPFPFTGVSDFESSIRMPVGETFVPRTSFKKLTQPKVKVAKGAVIEAMDKSQLVKRGIVQFKDMQELDVESGTF